MHGPEQNFLQIPEVDSADRDLYPAMLGTIVTAKILIDDFVKLSPGDTVIQNISNGGVGLAVAQYAFSKRLRTINIVRQGNYYTETVERMKQLGAYIVCPPDYVNSWEFRRTISDIPPPKLALNGLGGPSVAQLARVLAPGGTLVTYGGASLQPVQVPTSALMFNDINLRGFWLPNWIEKTSNEEKRERASSAIKMLTSWKLFCATFLIEDFVRGIQRFEKPGQKHERVVLTTQPFKLYNHI